jgi:hypothetical protein
MHSIFCDVAVSDEVRRRNLFQGQFVRVLAATHLD